MVLLVALLIGKLSSILFLPPPIPDRPPLRPPFLVSSIPDQVILCGSAAGEAAAGRIIQARGVYLAIGIVFVTVLTSQLIRTEVAI